jgi:alkylation response protein AidB-like acyl-CoA dehydrogenase
MEIVLTADQELFVETTRKFLASAASTEALRQLREVPEGFDLAYWHQGAELGWISLLVDEEFGGGSVSGEPVRDVALIGFQFGRFAAPGPLIATNVVASALSRAGSAAQRENELAAIMAGEVVASWAYAERGVGNPLGQVELSVAATGDELVLSGTKVEVEYGAQSELVLVTGRSADGLVQVLVPTDTPGVTVTPMGSIDMTRRFAEIEFTDVHLPATAAVGVAGASTEADVERQFQLALVIQTAETVGAMDRSFEITRAWLTDRYSFGRPLDSYQELKHRSADMKMWLEASHALADEAAVAVETGHRDAELISVAKAYIATVGPELAQDCVQMHGGIGLTFEHDIHLFLRRITLNSVLFGTPADHHLRLTDLIEAQLDERMPA